MSTDIENRIELSGARENISELLCILPERRLLLEEFRRNGVVLEHFYRGGVERSFAALGRGNGELGLVMEDIPGVREFGLLRNRSSC
jgi:hypothetical protein